ncbi:hypothetical protein C8J56DRAFT_1173414 [Mycena floridula]|nr:hypothetical protein C8J56DRAFT_1173414 [Mycena floridula]
MRSLLGILVPVSACLGLLAVLVTPVVALPTPGAVSERDGGALNSPGHGGGDQDQIELMEMCTDTGFHGLCAIAVPHDTQMPTPCANMSDDFAAKVSAARGITDGYTCFLYSQPNCVGVMLTVSGSIPDFLDDAIEYNDRAMSWYCDS